MRPSTADPSETFVGAHAEGAPGTLPLSARKRAIVRVADEDAERRDAWIDRNAFFHAQELQYLRFLVPEGRRVLEIGCGTGRVLAGLRPSVGVGLDISAAMLRVARRNHPGFTFIHGDVESAASTDLLRNSGPYDAIVLTDTMAFVDDVYATLESLQPLCHNETRIVIAHHSHLWEPVIGLGERAGMKRAYPDLNYLSASEVTSLLEMTGFEIIKQDWRQLSPRPLLGVGALFNRWVAPLPGIRRLSLRHYVVARSRQVPAPPSASCTIVIPCRNERGNIVEAIRRTPQFSDHLEFIFVEGHSKDGTWEETLRVRDANPDKQIVCLQQKGVGKGDAVRMGFEAARGDIVMILDADLTVRPEDLPKFYGLLASGRAEFVNGSRFVYPMEGQAMRFLNYLANRFFAAMFSYLLNQSFSDTLCGTKALHRRSYEMIAANRAYFGDFDPFGDFDLIFGAARLNLRMLEVPVRYGARTYGTTQISRFTHGALLLRMVVFAFRKLKLL